MKSKANTPKSIRVSSKRSRLKVSARGAKKESEQIERSSTQGKIVLIEPQMANIHKANTKVVRLENGQYGVEFDFDDGYTDFAEVESNETAEFYARIQMGEDIPIGVNPLLLSAAKAETLRRR